MSGPPVLFMSNHVDGIGGVERVVTRLAAGLADRGYEVALYGLTPVDGPGHGLPKNQFESGFMSDRVNVAAHRRRGFPKAVDRAYRSAHRLRQEIRAEVLANLDRTLRRFADGILVCSQVYVMEHVYELGLPDPRRGGPRIVGQYHGSFEMARSGNEYRRLWKTYRDLDRFLLLTERDRELFREQGFNNTGYLPNPLSFWPARLREERERLVVAMSRYDRQKSLDHAIRAWSTIAPRFPDWRFELYGTGPEEDRLRDLIEKLGISSSARLMGSTSDPASVLERASLHVLSSQHEGLPMVLGEAMACGVPSVAYNCAPGIADLLGHEKDGIIVPKDSVSLLGDGLARLMEDDIERERMSSAARAAARRFDLDVVLDQWEELFRKVMR